MEVGATLDAEAESMSREAEAMTPADEEALRAAEEKRKAEEEKQRFEEEVQKRADAIVNAKRAAIEAEYKRLVSSGNANAERMIADAKVKTKAVFEAAAEQCEKLKELARHDGFAAGYEAGKEEALKKCEKYLEAAAKFLSEINSRKEAYYISHEYELCETVMAMVRKITMSEIKTDPAVIDRIIADAAKGFRNSDYVKISLCEGEASKELVTDAEFVKSLIPFIPEVEIEELSREDVPEGTIVLDNGSEIIDASIPTQLDFLREIVRSSGGSAEGKEPAEEKEAETIT